MNSGGFAQLDDVSRDWLVTRLRQVAALLGTTCPGSPLRTAQELQRSIVARVVERPPPTEPSAQTELRLPLPKDAIVPGCPLGSGVRVAMCIARQIAGDHKPVDPNRDPERARHDGKRGVAVDDAHCESRRCALGRSIREAAAPVAIGRGTRRSGSDYLRR
jgi:hypothetical protein